VAKKTVFMVMPFSDDTVRLAYDHCVKPVCKKHDLQVRNASEMPTTSVIYEDILSEIEKAAVVICDISGRNPNVFYELGIAHTLKRSSTIMLTHDEVTESPFDIQHFRIFSYENSMPGQKQLTDKLDKCLQLLLNKIDVVYENEFETAMKTIAASSDRSQLLVRQR
jgi:hypothetical protein